MNNTKLLSPTPVPVDELFVVGISSSALFDTQEGARIFENEGEAAFIAHHVKHEDVPFEPGPAMPLVRALMETNDALGGAPRAAVSILSHTNPAATGRAVKSMRHYGIPVHSAAFVRDGNLANYIKAHGLSLFLSRNRDDVRAALSQGVAAAHLPGALPTISLPSGQLRIAFDCDAVLFSDESERVYKQSGLKAFYEHERVNENVPLPPGPFAPVLRWISRIQREARAAGGKFDVRIAIVTARNDDAISRVVQTFRQWDVSVDEAFFRGNAPKDKILEAFAPHMFFDDQVRHIEPACKVVPAAHVLYGIANEAVVPVVSTTVVTPSLTVAAVPATSAPDSSSFITQKDFDLKCRAIFRGYTALGGKKNGLDPRYRRFISDHVQRSGEERMKILQALKKYDLRDIVNHDPLLNRELPEMVVRKLNSIVDVALGHRQQDLPLA